MLEQNTEIIGLKYYLLWEDATLPGLFLITLSDIARFFNYIVSPYLPNPARVLTLRLAIKLKNTPYEL